MEIIINTLCSVVIAIQTVIETSVRLLIDIELMQPMALICRLNLHVLNN